jgi:hypothetical protein
MAFNITPQERIAFLKEVHHRSLCQGAIDKLVLQAYTFSVRLVTRRF